MATRLAEGVRQGARSLGRTPGFAVAAAVTLGAALGPMAAVYAVLHQVVLSPLDYPTVDDVVVLRSQVSRSAPGEAWGLSVAQYFHFADNAQSLAEIGAYESSMRHAVLGQGRPSRVVATSVTGGVHAVVGARALLGRPFDRSDHEPGARRAAVLSQAYWEREFGGDPGVLGRSIWFDPGIVGRPVTPEMQEGMSFEIVGVIADIALPRADAHRNSAAGTVRTDIWVPFPFVNRTRAVQNPPFHHHTLGVIGRVAPTASLERARLEVGRLAERLPEAYPTVYDGRFVEEFGFRTRLLAAEAYVVGEATRRILWLLQGAATLLLAIALANAANLYLVRLEAGRAELAVRIALGARTSDLVRQAFAQCGLLVAAGSCVGWYLAVGLTEGLGAVAPATWPRLGEVALGGNELAAYAAVSLGVVVAMTGPPAWYVLRLRRTGVAEAGRGVTASPERRRARAAMVVGQVAVAAGLMVAAGLFVETFHGLRAAETGIDADRTASIAMYPSSSHVEPAAWWQAVKRILAHVERVPGVSMAGAASGAPFSGELSGGCAEHAFENPQVDDRGLGRCAVTAIATPGWFRTLGVPLLRGRAFETADLDSPSPGAVVVSRAFADHFWPGQDPIGQRVAPKYAYDAAGDVPWYSVVGVVGDVFAGSVEETPALVAYYPLVPTVGSYWFDYSLRLAFRTDAAQPTQLLPAVRAAIEGADATAVTGVAEAMSTLVDRSMGRVSLASGLLGMVAGIALFLAAMGLYSVVANLVACRTQEVGIRVALGARVSRLRRMIVLGTARHVGVGLLLGLLAGTAAAGAARAQFHGLAQVSALVVVCVGAVLALVAMAATWLATTRVSAVQPQDVLRG